MSGYRDFAGFYDLLTEDVDYTARAAYFHQLAQRYTPPGRLLLDLACGTGSLSLALSRLGYDVIGVDGSYEMLSVAMEKRGEEPILFLCQDMENLDLYGTVDLTISALDSLNHVTQPEHLQTVFNRVSLFTNPGGLFLFDMNTPYKHREILADNAFVYDLDQLYCVWQNDLDEDGRKVTIHLDFFVPEEDGKYSRWEEEIQERAYTQKEIQCFVERAGLELLEVFHEDSMEPPRPDSQRLVYLARKPVHR